MFYYKINYVVGGLATILISLSLGIMIFLHGRGTKVVRSYFFLMLSVSAWALGVIMAAVSRSAGAALFWGRVLHIGASFLAAFYVNFSLRVISTETKKKALKFSSYFIASIFGILSFTPYLIGSASEKLGFFYPDPGVLYPLFILFFIGYPGTTFFIFYKNYSRQTDLGKRQFKYIAFSGAVGLLGGYLTFFTVYGIRIPLIGPFAMYLVAFANIFIAIATYTVQLMDVEIIRRRTVIFSLLYGAAVGTFVAMVFIGQKILLSYFNINRWVLPFAALFVITIFIRPLENLLAKATDKVLYQRRYDYMETLKNAAKGMTVVTDTKKLLNLMAHLVSKEVRVTGCAIYIYNRTANAYILEVVRGFKGLEIAGEVDGDSSLIEWLREKQQPLNYENVLNWLQGERLFQHRLVLKRTLEQIRVIMKNLNAYLCVPSFFRQDMIGFMVLGPKLSGDRYTMDDISLLSTLANNAAIAFENARMYEELKRKIAMLHNLYHEEHRLFLDAASAFSYAIDAKYGFAHAHALRVSEIAACITRELEGLLPYIRFDDKFYDGLKIASLLHDVGKIGVPDKILNKKVRLSAKEGELLKEHVIIGERILSPIKEIDEVFAVIRHHHENFDGTGYPDGLMGNEIPMMSRIIAVANTLDTLTSERPNHKPVNPDEAMAGIKDNSGTIYDPVIVEALIKASEKGVISSLENLKT